MRRGRQNFELKLFGCKNVPYVGQINVRWWGKKYLGVQKAPGGAKKLQGAPKSSRGRKKPIRKTEKIVATFFFYLFFFFLGDSKKLLFRGAKNFSRGAPNGKHG